ncbi:hypothetical protein [Clavibacter zhangzhiyongii]|uniref:hypothetical protein n=1 Tax=Clavibacter zhangzhiyongii TaxID=2768071 RepID=UPI0039E14505
MAPRIRTIALLGDSLTGDGGWDRLVPGPDAEEGAAAGVLDLGRAGQTADDVLALLPEAVTADPSTVVLSCGTHDLGADSAADPSRRSARSRPSSRTCVATCRRRASSCSRCRRGGGSTPSGSAS